MQGHLLFLQWDLGSPGSTSRDPPYFCLSFLSCVWGSFACFVDCIHNECRCLALPYSRRFSRFLVWVVFLALLTSMVSLWHCYVSSGSTVGFPLVLCSECLGLGLRFASFLPFFMIVFVFCFFLQLSNLSWFFLSCILLLLSCS